jgi:nucleoid-associated protein YgaU
MGLFDFLKGAGKKIENEAGTTDELKKSVESMNLNIKDFNVAFSNGVATIRGVAATQKDLELARLVVGNHQGVEKVNDDGLTVAASAPTTVQGAPGLMYTVKPGDTLSKIAKDQLGDANKYPELFEANRPMLSDPNKIYPGQVLRVPKLAA